VQPSSVATGGSTLPRPCWVMGFAEILSFFFGGGGGEMDDGLRKQTCVEKHLTAANCSYISGFWGLRPRLPPGSAPGLRWGSWGGGLPFPTLPMPTWLQSLVRRWCNQTNQEHDPWKLNSQSLEAWGHKPGLLESWVEVGAIYRYTSTIAASVIVRICSTRPGTANPLNFIQTTWGIGSTGVNDARNCRPPRFWTWQGTAPSFTMISRLPAPACDASTAQTRHQSMCLLTDKMIEKNNAACIQLHT